MQGGQLEREAPADLASQPAGRGGGEGGEGGGGVVTAGV